MSAPVYAVREEDSVYHARHEMLSRGVSKLPVVDGDAGVLGIVTKSDIVFSSDFDLRPEKRSPLQDRFVRDVMSSEVHTVEAGAGVGTIVGTMARRNISAIPVVSGSGALQGLVTETDVLDHVTRALRGRYKVEGLMTEEMITVNPDSSLSSAIERMRSHGMHQVPVLRDQATLVGILTLSDILHSRWFEPGGRTGSHVVRGRREEPGRHHRAEEVDGLVEAAMTKEVTTVDPGRDVQTAAGIMRGELFNALPVVNGADPVGIITRYDLLQAWADDAA